MLGLPHLKEVYDSHQTEMGKLTGELKDLRGQLTANDVLLDTIERYLPRIEQGDHGSMRGHIKHGHHPVTTQELRFGRFVEFFSAVSIGIIMIAYVILLFVSPAYVWRGMVILLLVMAFIEAWARHRLHALVSFLTNTLAVVAALILLFQFWFWILVTVVLLVGIYVTWQNVSEFWP